MSQQSDQAPASVTRLTPEPLPVIITEDENESKQEVDYNSLEEALTS